MNKFNVIKRLRNRDIATTTAQNDNFNKSHKNISNNINKSKNLFYC
jgi:hypothetical protein